MMSLKENKLLQVALLPDGATFYYTVNENKRLTEVCLKLYKFV